MRQTGPVKSLFVVVRVVGLLGHANDFDAAIFQVLNYFHEVGVPADGHLVECPGRAFHGILVELCPAVEGQDDGIDARALGRAGDGTHVAHIRDLVEQQQERHAALLENRRHDVVDVAVFDGRQERDHSLVVLPRESVQFLLWHVLERDLALPHLIEELLEQFALQALLEQDFIDGFAALNGLHHRAHAVGDFLVFGHLFGDL